MNSVLNPEAPEFYPHLTSVTQGGYVSVSKSIKSSNNLPTGIAYGFFKTYTDFNIVTCQLSENVVHQSNQIIANELPAVKLKQNDPESNLEKIIDATDNILDRVYININTTTGANEPRDKFINQIFTKPVKIQVGSTTLIGAKNIIRPQLRFKDTINNSESLWVPKISDKPNSIKPLALNILYNDEGEAVGYEHPYKVELDLYHPPAQFVEPDTESLPFPAPLADTMYTYVDTEAQLDALVEHLLTVKEMAIDLEHHSYRTYQGITCLIQVTTTEGGDFLIDALAIREHIHKLNLVFTDPKKLKVFHGAEHDVLWLQRDFGVYIVGLFDTHQAAKVLKLQGLSLKHLLVRYCQVNADKRYQLADWRMRPLPDELIEYARSDTHYLVYIWREMKAELLKNDDPHLLLSVFENSRRMCGVTYNKAVVTDESHMALYLRSKKTFNSQQMSALKILYKWRDAHARELDESTTYLLPNQMLLKLAEMLPRDVQGLNAICCPMPPFVKQNVITIHQMILSCLELPNEPQLYQMPTSILNMVNNMLPSHSQNKYEVHDFTHHTDLPLNIFEVHDFAHHTEYSEENSDENTISLENDTVLFKHQPQIDAFSPSNNMISYGTINSVLNAEAKLFIPPYERYRSYRIIAQTKELKDFNEKEAKVAAISKGNELIKAEVINKLQQAKTMIENEDKVSVQIKVGVEESDETQMKLQQRKRKISAEKVEPNESTNVAVENIGKEFPNNDTKNNDVKPFVYKNADYKKFFNHTNKEYKQKQPKMKFKKYKK